MDEIMCAQPGDLIEIFHELYKHWAIYIGGREVVHLSPQNKDSGSFSILMILLATRKAQVKRQKIWEVAGSRKCRINNFLDNKRPPRNRRVIVTEAERLVGRELPFSVFSENCEHFVTALRYKKAESRQVGRAAALIGAALVAVFIIVALAKALSY